MPSWKRVIVSGSDAALHSLNVSNGITGSLYGTASNAVLASGVEGGKATHIPFFKTDTTFGTSSIYQSGSSTIIINQDNATTADPEALYVWQPHPTSVNVISGKGNLDSFLQLNIQNTNQGTKASSDVVATANNGNNSSNYIDMGINGENYQVDHTWWVGKGNDTYLVSVGGNHYMGSVNGGDIRLFVTSSSFDGDASTKLLLRGNDQHELTGSLNLQDTLKANNGAVLKNTTTISGSLLQTGSYIHTGSKYQSGNIYLTGTEYITGSLNVAGTSIQSGSNTLLGINLISGSLTISGSFPVGSTSASVKIHANTIHDGYIEFKPVTVAPDTSISASYVFVSGSTQDLYFAQNSNGHANVTRLRWLEGNMYTGLLNGGVIGSSSLTDYTVSAGSGIIVTMNASLTDNPYPTIQYVSWGNLTQSIAPLSADYDQQYVAIQSNGTIYAQGTPFFDGQFDTVIPVGVVLHQNHSTINNVKTIASVAYGWKQRSNNFINAFGPLKLSGFTIGTSGSAGLTVGSGTAFADGANYPIDPNNPSYITDSGTNVSKIWRYRQSGSAWIYDTNNGAGYSTVDQDYYNNPSTGVLTAMTNGQWAVQRLFWFPNSVAKSIVAYYGNAVYASEAEARANISFETFTEAPNTAANAIYLGAIAFRGDFQNWTQTDRYTVYPGGLFRQVGGSGGGGSLVTTTLAGLSDVAISGSQNGQPLVYSSAANKWINSSSVTASLQGNATTATTASYAVTASYAMNSIPAFPYTGSADITGSLTVTGSVISSVGFTGSLQGTATNAISSSYALDATNAISSSYAQSTTNAINANSGSDFVVTNTLKIDATLTDYATTNSTIVGVNNLFTQATGSYTAAFCKYTLSKGTNARAGEFMTAWNGTNITYTDTSTTDIGDTSDITFISTTVTGNVQISTIAASSGWKIKALVTFI